MKRSALLGLLITIVVVGSYAWLERGRQNVVLSAMYYNGGRVTHEALVTALQGRLDQKQVVLATVFLHRQGYITIERARAGQPEIAVYELTWRGEERAIKSIYPNQHL